MGNIKECHMLEGDKWSERIKSRAGKGIWELALEVLVRTGPIEKVKFNQRLEEGEGIAI